MKLRHPVFMNSLAFLGSLACRFLRRTIDWRGVYFDPTIDPVHPEFSGRYIFAVWHEYMTSPILMRAHCRILALASDHADGEVIAKLMHHLGWSVARGSTTRGGVKALMRFLQERDCHITLTPDGPRGPRRKMSLGPIILASKLGLPLICVGYAYRRPWRLRSWDRFAIPKPFSKARAYVGPPLCVPSNLNREGLERYRIWFEDLLNWLTLEAENWAESGTTREGSMPMLLQEAPAAMRRSSPPTTKPLTLPEDLRERWSTLQPTTTDSAMAA